MKKHVKVEPIYNTYQSIKQILEEARRKSYAAVNFAMVQAYWNIGRIIVEEEQRGKTKAGYGEFLLRELSERLTKDFGRGFDPSNLRYLRVPYLILQNQLSGQPKGVIFTEIDPIDEEFRESSLRRGT